MAHLFNEPSSAKGAYGLVIKTEELSENETYGTNLTDGENEEALEIYNSDLIEDLDSNQKINEKINQYFNQVDERINKNNLLSYCGIFDPASETDGSARANSIYVAKFGKSHIKKTKIVNPYGALSQKYQSEILKIQKQKLNEYSTNFVKPVNMAQMKKNNNEKAPE